MKARGVIWSAFLLLSVGIFICSAERLSHPLKSGHKKWLEKEVVYIISDYERQAFLNLPSDELRDEFIKKFWEVRDPTPGTKRNEFKEEHYRRIEYANKYFGRETSLPGWMTDRGRIFILFGEPMNRESFNSMNVRPIELWHYMGVQQGDIPSSFYLVFFKKYGTGPYRLYSPAVDGLESLFEQSPEIASAVSSSDYDYLYSYLYRHVDVTLAHAAFSLLPTEGGYLVGGYNTGRVASEMLLGKIEDIRNYDLNEQWVNKFLGRGKVEVEYAFQAFNVDKVFHWFQAPTGDYFLDYALRFNPQDLALGQYKDKYFTALEVYCTLLNDKDKVLARFRHGSDIELSESKFEAVKYRPFEYQGRVPVIPGRLHLNIIIRNKVSKTFSTVSTDLNVPELNEMEGPHLGSILPLRSVKSLSSLESKPFRVENYALYPEAKPAYSPNDTLPLYFQVFFDEGSAISLDVGKLVFEFSFIRGGKVVERKLSPFYPSVSQVPEGAVSWLEQLNLSSLSGGTYQLEVVLKEGNDILAISRPITVEIVPQRSPSPWILTSKTPHFSSSATKYLIADEYLANGDEEEGRGALERIIYLDPGFLKARLRLMELYFNRGDYNKVVKLGEEGAIKYPREARLLKLLGTSYFRLANYWDAIRFLERVKMELPKDITVINLLASSYLKLGDKERALSLIEESLSLNPDQPDIKKLKKKIIEEGQ